MYLHQRNHWWEFLYDGDAVMNMLGSVRAGQGLLLGRMSSLGFDKALSSTEETLSTVLGKARFREVHRPVPE